MSKQLNQDRMEDALAYLSDTDELCANLKADVERAEWKAKRTEDAVFLRLTGTIAERTADSKTHVEAQAAWNEYFRLLKDFECIRNKRSTESIVVEAWRSVNSNRRQGA